MPHAASETVERIYREESGRILAAMIRVVRDFDLADDAMQDAFTKAMERWPAEGIPDNPAAWITTTARNAVIDRLRRQHASRRVPFDETIEEQAGRVDEIEMLERRLESSISDDRLRLIFTCCHPSLNQEAQIALTLRTLGGLTTPEIARAFLVSETVVAQRIVRAKRKIKGAKIPYQVPPDHLLPERVPAVLAVLYLVFNEGYSPSTDARLIRDDLCAEAIRLGRVLTALMPDEPEAIGLLALMLLHDSRRAARTSKNGELILLEEQDRSLWNAEQIQEGCNLVERALRHGRPGSYQLQAAIAAVHAEASDPEQTDWPQIVRLYDTLAQINPSPVVALNRAVAVAFAEGFEAGLAELDRLQSQGDLENYVYLHSAKADLLRRMKRYAEARQAFEHALKLATNGAERRLLERRLKECDDQAPIAP